MTICNTKRKTNANSSITLLSESNHLPFKGFVEPLGFAECSLRSKKMAIQAIRESGQDVYRLVHDTFHHFLGPDDRIFPAETGIVHISGVEIDIDQA